MLSIYQIRMGTFWVFLLIMVIARVRKRRKTARLCGCFCVLILVSHVYLFNEFIDKVRFPILRPFYEARAKTFLEEEKKSGSEGEMQKRRNSSSCIFLTQSHEYEINRRGNIISIYFPTDANFFSGHGYIYTENDPNAAELDYTQNENILLTIKDYDEIDFIDEHWAYIKRY